MEKKIFEKLDSTNVKAQNLIGEGKIKDACWVYTYDQFMGKGLGENRWYSEPGKNITGSLVIFPVSLNAEDQFNVSMMASLAVYDLLSLYFNDPYIKWPNDIFLGKSKVGGLLIEHSVSGKFVSYSIIGIGLNINQQSFPRDIDNATSLSLKINYELDLEEVNNLLLKFLEKRLSCLEEKGNKRIKEEYIRKLFRYKEFAPYKSDGIWFMARIIDVDNYGRLVLEKENNKILKFGFKEVEFID